MLANQRVDRNGLLCCSHLVVLGLFILMIVSGTKLFTSVLDFFLRFDSYVFEFVFPLYLFESNLFVTENHHL